MRFPPRVIHFTQIRFFPGGMSEGAMMVFPFVATLVLASLTDYAYVGGV